jgi:hypothetical protein
MKRHRPHVAAHPRLAALLFALLISNSSMVAAQSSGGAAFNLGGIKTAICGVVTQLSATELIGAAGVLAIIAFGWNKLMGESNAFQGVKNVAIGAFFILGASGLAASVFGGGC